MTAKKKRTFKVWLMKASVGILQDDACWDYVISFTKRPHPIKGGDVRATLTIAPPRKGRKK